jgi:hypothetical protein
MRGVTRKVSISLCNYNKNGMCIQSSLKLFSTRFHEKLCFTKVNGSLVMLVLLQLQMRDAS